MAKADLNSWIDDFLKTQRVVRLAAPEGFKLAGGSDFRRYGPDPTPHVVTWQQCFDLCYIFQGHGEYIDCQNRRYKLYPGVFFLRLPEIHAVQVQSETYAEFYLSLSQVALDFLKVFQSNVTKTPRVIDFGLHREVVLRYERLFQEIRDTPEPKLAQTALHVLEFYLEILGESSSRETKLIEDACLLIKSDPASREPLEHTAHKLGLGYSNFRRLFHEKIGLSPGDYRINKRLELACELLSAGLSQKQVAFKLGYTDVQGFSRQFRRFIGLSPGMFLYQTHRKQRFPTE
jgi:AraC-like DNA-binding protein